MGWWTIYLQVKVFVVMTLTALCLLWIVGDDAGCTWMVYEVGDWA